MIDPGNTGFKKHEIISEEQYSELKDEQPDSGFEANMGAEAIRELLAKLDLDELSAELRAQVQDRDLRAAQEGHAQAAAASSRRSGRAATSPEWMILDVLPVLPPDLRPLVPLEGGRFATSDLNDLYRRVINRNNRLKKLIDIRRRKSSCATRSACCRRRSTLCSTTAAARRAVRGQGNRPLKSLSDMLKGKQGRFRQNLLGKRVDYSGRSVIVVGPELKLHQCGLPKNMALELFKPFIIKKLEERGYVQTVKSAKRLVEREQPEVWDILGEIIENHPVLLNRAPTLHRLGIQALRAGARRRQGDPHPPAGLRGVQRGLRRRPDGGARSAVVRGADRDRAAHALDAQHPVAGERPPARDAEPGHRARLPLPDEAAWRERQSARGGAEVAGDDPRRLRVFHSPLEVRAAYDNREVTLNGQIAMRASSVSSRANANPYVDHDAGPRALQRGGAAGAGLHQRDHGQEAPREAGRRLLLAARPRDHVGSARRAEGPRFQVRDAGRVSRSASTTCAFRPRRTRSSHARSRTSIEINAAATATA